MTVLYSHFAVIFLLLLIYRNSVRLYCSRNFSHSKLYFRFIYFED